MPGSASSPIEAYGDGISAGAEYIVYVKDMTEPVLIVAMDVLCRSYKGCNCAMLKTHANPIKSRGHHEHKPTLW
jgi:hypothetical protein